MLKRLGRLVLLAALALLVVIQLVPYGRDHTNPPVRAEPAWDSPQTRALAVRACFDCHSNETTWPWYSNVAPFSWLIQRDVDEGRKELNFSNWGNSARSQRLSNNGVRELTNVILRNSMPPFYYTMLHPSAGLSMVEKDQLIQGLKNSISAAITVP